MDEHNNGFVFTEDEVLNRRTEVRVPAYIMTREKFVILLQWQTDFTSLGFVLLSAFIGFGIKIVSVIFAYYYSRNNEIQYSNTIEDWEWIALVVCIVSAIIFFLLGRFLPTKRSKLLKDINNVYNTPQIKK